MTPDEKNLLSGLFDRIRAADTGPRDAEAERFIADATRQNPNAAYVLSQTVLIQEQALGAANQRIQELQAQVSQTSRAAEPGGSFLGNIGKSLFGTAQPAPPPRQPVYAQQPSYGQQSGPWGAAPSAGGSFLSGALHTAAGVAGGMLLADGIRSLFGGHHGNALMSDMAGNTNPLFGSDSFSSNLYNDPGNQRAADYLQDQDQDQDDAQDAADYASDDSSSFGDDTSDA